MEERKMIAKFRKSKAEAYDLIQGGMHHACDWTTINYTQNQAPTGGRKQQIHARDTRSFSGVRSSQIYARDGGINHMGSADHLCYTESSRLRAAEVERDRARFLNGKMKEVKDMKIRDEIMEINRRASTTGVKKRKKKTVRARSPGVTETPLGRTIRNMRRSSTPRSGES